VQVAAHLILGSREEPFLNAMLSSLEGVASTLIVNDNAAGASPHAAVLESSAFARTGRLVVDRTPFAGFAAARNVCLALHAQHAAGEWVAFVDADDVHGPQAATIASHLSAVPRDVAFVDGYEWHFYQSFDWYTSIERRMMFFRFSRDARWEGLVHEHLLGVEGRRIALPYVYAHYGHTLEPRRHAEKARHYSSLGAQGGVLDEDELPSFDPAQYFAPEYPRLLRFRGRHPAAARSTVEMLRPRLAASHAITARMAGSQPASVKARNVLRRANYELRWRGRAANPLARYLLQGPTPRS
jgi:hypothetical protein